MTNHSKPNKQLDPYLPKEVRIIKHEQESSDVFTIHLAFTNPEDAAHYHVLPGQFNMLYAYGIGEIPISVVSDIAQEGPLAHSIRSLGSATQVLSSLKEGAYLGLRGPFGHGWPLQTLRGKNIIIITGGIGSAPVITAVNEIIKNRDDYQQLIIIHGIRQQQDWIYQSQYHAWQQAKNTQVYLACQEISADKNWHQGLVTDCLDQVNFDNLEGDTACLMCGPQKMMQAATQKLLLAKLLPQMIFLSLERNMQCGIGHCGHCQCGAKFVCKEGPVFSYDQISAYMDTSS